MTYGGLVLLVMCMTGVFTLVTLHGYGVNVRNHRMFVKVLRLKLRKAGGNEIGNALYEYIVEEIRNRGKWAGRYDIRPAEELLDEQSFDDAMTVLVGRLLGDNYKPVSIDRSGYASVVLG